MIYSGIAWKHHIAEHFVNGIIPTHPNGAGKGGTIFIDYEKMVKYLKEDGRDWYIAELNLENEPLLLEFNNDYMATIQRNCQSELGFKPLILTKIK